MFEEAESFTIRIDFPANQTAFLPVEGQVTSATVLIIDSDPIQPPPPPRPSPSPTSPG